MNAVLEGSVRRAGNRVRITAQLVSVNDGYHLWSERYDRELTDIFVIQDEIATVIAGRLRRRFAAVESKSLVRASTSNLEAYELYLKARALMKHRGSSLLVATESWTEPSRSIPSLRRRSRISPRRWSSRASGRPAARPDCRAREVGCRISAPA